MTPSQYEELVARYFREKGYKAEKTPDSHDYGVDVFAESKGKKIAIQAKLYGSSTRKVNRQMVMELHGAKDYFDCHSAIIATPGEIIPNAKEVADKLNIELLNISPELQIGMDLKEIPKSNFDKIWEKYIVPLEGKILRRKNGKSNEIVKVDWSGIQRITSNGKSQKIDIEIFRKAINCILEDGSITREKINQEYVKRASSGIVLILAQVPIFQVKNKPLTVELVISSEDKLFC